MGINDKTRKKVAVKIMSKEKLKIKNEKVRKHIKKELKIMQGLHHENLIKFKKIVKDEKNYYIILEYAPNGDLFELINRNNNQTHFLW